MTSLTFIGFGEAGAAFARAGDAAFDIKSCDAASVDAKNYDYHRAGVTGWKTAKAALHDAEAIISVVTADQALAVAEQNASFVPAGRLWMDFNSVAPETKRAAACAIEAAGGHYVDVAVMAPVHPAKRSVPLLVAGPHAGEAIALLRHCGFRDVAFAGAQIGAASAIKMIRSVMVKGLEALTAECACAAERAGVLDAVLQSLDASPPLPKWGDRADYNLERMMVHGLRRAAEMEEAAKTLADLGITPSMTCGTIELQRHLGGLGLAPPAGLKAKLAAMDNTKGWGI